MKKAIAYPRDQVQFEVFPKQMMVVVQCIYEHRNRTNIQHQSSVDSGLSVVAKYELKQNAV